jgi:hypothetical protein
MEYFRRIVHLDPVCFCDEPHASTIRETGLSRVLPYDEKDTFFPKYLETQREILARPDFEKIRAQWPNWPAFEKAEYGLVNFSKACLIRRASELFPDYTHYAWIDFGYAKGPDDVPSEWQCDELVAPDKIIIGSCRDLFLNEQGEMMYGAFASQDRSQAIMYNWNNPHNVMRDLHFLIHGNLWFVPKKLTHWFEKEMDRTIQRHHELGYASHDEPFWLPIIHDFPSRFHIHVKETWTGDFTWMKASSNTKVLWVTAYKDLGRSEWAYTQRPFKDYIDAFKRIQHLNPVCFIDEPWATQVREQTGHTRILPLNAQDTFISKYVDRQKEILADPVFQKLIPDYLKFNPEFHYPEYGLVNCAKTCFVRRASELFPEYTHYSWIDFGFAKTDDETPPHFDCNSLIDEKRILISSFRSFGLDADGEPAMGPYGVPSDDLNERYNWNNPKMYLTRPPHLIQGNHWVVPRSLTHWLEKEMARSIERNHELGIVRADESFFLPIIHDFRTRFHVHVKPYSDVTWIADMLWRKIEVHFDRIRKIIEPTFAEWYGAGSYLINGKSLDYDRTMLEKQLALYQVTRGRKRALEIGVHAGHSLLLMLLADPNVVIECVDICIWEHTEKCVEYLQSVFPGRIIFHKGDSRSVVCQLTGEFDLVHIDGAHDINVIREEVGLIRSTPDALFVFDDFDTAGLPQYVNDTFENVRETRCPYRNCVASTKKSSA